MGPHLIAYQQTIQGVTHMALMERYARPQPPIAGNETDVLLGFLDFLRETIAIKSMDLPDDDCREPHVPSGMSLLGITKHLTYVERSWFRGNFLGEDLEALYGPRDRTAEWIVLETEAGDAIRAAYREEWNRSNEIVRANSLDDVIRSHTRPEREGMQLRWIVAHMIEETARHAGHMDLIREAIDGEVGA
jgi:uncharacterized damage-inducible protein DinB